MIMMPACPLPPPPLRSYEHCPDATEDEWKTQCRLYSIFASGAIIAGVNILLLASAGIESGVFNQFISKVEVDKDIVSDLVTQSSTDFVPMNGTLVKCTKKTTYHLTYWNLFLSSTVLKQVDTINQAMESLADSVQEFVGVNCQQKIVKRANKNDELPFCTTDQANIDALVAQYANAEAAKAAGYAKSAATRKGAIASKAAANGSIKKADKLNLPYFQLESVSRCKEAKKARPPFVPIYSCIAADLREELVKERSLKMNNEVDPREARVGPNKKIRDWIMEANDSEDKSCTFSVGGYKKNRADFPYDEWKISIHLTTATICENAKLVEGDRAKDKTA